MLKVKSRAHIQIIYFNTIHGILTFRIGQKVKRPLKRLAFFHELVLMLLSVWGRTSDRLNVQLLPPRTGATFLQRCVRHPMAFLALWRDDWLFERVLEGKSESYHTGATVAL